MNNNEKNLVIEEQSVIEKYGFYDTENAFLCNDGFCWVFCVNLAKCKKEKTGDKITLKTHIIEKEVSCVAEIYKLIWNEEEYKDSDITEEMELYVAIGVVEKYGWSLISSKNKYFGEATRIMNERIEQRKISTD